MAREQHNRKIELYKTAALLFNKRGYPTTSIRQICKIIGIRESSIYNYIRSKEELLFNICEWSMSQLLDEIEPIVKQDLKPELKLQKMINLHVVNLTKTYNEHSTMIKEMQYLSKPKRQKIIQMRDRYEGYFRIVIRDCMGERYFRHFSVKLSSLVLLGMINSLVRWFSPDGPLDGKKIAGIYSGIFFSGMRDNPLREISSPKK